MFRIGIDVGSTYIKYCVMEDERIVELMSEKTPLKQRAFFQSRVKRLLEEYPGAAVASCGYGRDNVDSVKSINELTALARGSFFLTGEDGLVLDVGGQDTKITYQERGRILDFFLNDKCAAGSGMFLTSILDKIGADFASIDLTGAAEPRIHLSSVCAVFAQSEIVELIADNVSEEEIIHAVIWQIFVKAKALLGKVNDRPLLLSGGLTKIPGIAEYAGKTLGRMCRTAEHSAYLSAIGCAISL